MGSLQMAIQDSERRQKDLGYQVRQEGQEDNLNIMIAGRGQIGYDFEMNNQQQKSSQSKIPKPTALNKPPYAS